MPDWIKRKDTDLREQAMEFSKGISADPEAFGATPLQAAELAEKVAAFDAAFRLTIASGTDTTCATIAKRNARAALVACMRLRARLIRVMSEVTSSQRINLEMGIDEPRRTRIPRPADTPAITLGRPREREIPLYVKSTLTPTRRGLPRDVAAVQVFCIASPNMPAISDMAWRPLGLFSKAHFTINLNFRDIQSGDTVWIAARYTNAKSQTGKWSSPVKTYALGPALIFKGLDLFTPQAA